MDKKEAIENVEKQLEGIKKANECGLATRGEFNKDIQAIETVLNLLEKKDKIIDSIKEYAQQEIDFATEDIEDYIDDDREGNKDIIGELKEWREHWKDIIRIMNNEKTYIDFEYKVEEGK